MDRKFNYVYVTTCLINNKQYVGSHCTDNIDDNYIGSGRLFLKAVRKHGKGDIGIFPADEIITKIKKENNKRTRD